MPLYKASTASSITFSEEGVSQGTATNVNFTGASVTVSVAAGTATVTDTGLTQGDAIAINMGLNSLLPQF